MDQSELLQGVSLPLDFTSAVSDEIIYKHFNGSNVSLAPVSVHGKTLTDSKHTVSVFCNQENKGFHIDKVSLPAMTGNSDDDDLNIKLGHSDRSLDQVNIAYEQGLEGNISLKHPISVRCQSQKKGPQIKNLKTRPFLEVNNHYDYRADHSFSETKLLENCIQSNGSMNEMSVRKDYQVINETSPGSSNHYVSPLTTKLIPGETSQLVTAQDNEMPPNIYSDSLIRENELELSKVKQLTLHQNSSIYKLAFDESFTDHPDDEVQQLESFQEEFSVYSNKNKLASPSSSSDSIENEVHLQEDSLMTNQRQGQALEEMDEFSRLRSEIIVHEMDTVSEAGSEDVELIPHRYESQTAAQKHIYVNKLTLAVELLRTKEVLPYDEELKPVPLGHQEEDVLPEVHVFSSAEGAVNQSFVKESDPHDSKEQVQTPSSIECEVKTTQPQGITGVLGEEIQKSERRVQGSQTKKGYSLFGSSPSVQPNIGPTHLASARGLCCVTM